VAAEYWELQLLLHGSWDEPLRYDSREHLEATLELLKGCPTNDGQPRRYRVRHFTATNEVEGSF